MQLRVFRRTLAAGAVWTAAMAGLLVSSPSASGQEAVEPGRGSAFAQGVKVDPRGGRLSFGITYGMALAGHQNTVAIADARSVDLGPIGTTLAGQSCTGGDPTLPKEDQPQPLEARSTDEGADQEQVESEIGVEKRAVANSEPYARAVATTAGGGDPAAVAIGATSSLTESGIVDGRRIARSRTVVEQIVLAGGQVVLEGLRWEALYQSAPAEEAKGSFTIDGLVVGGERVPLPEDNPLEGLAEANAVLLPLGFRLDPPSVRNESGIQFVEPLRIGVVPSTARESVIGPVFNGVQPVRESVFDAMIEADCRAATAITVLDLVLNAVTGAGSLNIEVGGVTATSDDIELTSFLGGLGGLGGAPSLPPLPEGSTGASSGALGPTARTGGTALGTGTGTAGAGSPPAAGPGSDGGDEHELADAAPISAEGARGGALAGVGLGGLAALAALAAADRHKMRKAQRSVLMEAF